jgi:hypothetical protein
MGFGFAWRFADPQLNLKIDFDQAIHGIAKL